MRGGQEFFDDSTQSILGEKKREGERSSKIALWRHLWLSQKLIDVLTIFYVKYFELFGFKWHKTQSVITFKIIEIKSSIWGSLKTVVFKGTGWLGKHACSKCFQISALNVTNSCWDVEKSLYHIR